METTIPLMPCANLRETLAFYRNLGFEVTYEQHEPYPYGAVQHGTVDLHFARLTNASRGKAFGACLVMVDDVARYHRAYADALRAAYGRIPTAGQPRLTRFWPGHTRFKIVDPAGNLLTYIDRSEEDGLYPWSEEEKSPLARAHENAVFLRDVYIDDAAAAKLLDKALARKDAADPVEKARALALRAELAVALGEIERAHTAREALQTIELADADRRRYQHELKAADWLERWLTEKVEAFDDEESEQPER